jgi:mannose-6-phosphate isomerase
MKAAQDSHFATDESTPYAELWLGTHPSGMSMVSVDNDEQVSLKNYVESNPKVHCGNAGFEDLSFLLKVLSINKVLSIQAHPDKKLAERLHEASPNVYKDPNHKPEMAIALSEKVQAMCGFRPIDEIVNHLEAYPELCIIIGEQARRELTGNVPFDQARDVLQNMFQCYLGCSDECVQNELNNLLIRLKTIENRDELQNLMLSLAEQFPNDAGIFAPLMFNVITCHKGEAIFIDANEPHAYISGELIECMACSDNVVRAGLTPKLKDVDTLVNMLTYKSQSPDIYRGCFVDDYTLRYEPPVADFCVEVIDVPSGHSYEVMDVDSPSIILTLAGAGTLQQEGVCSMDVSFGKAAFCSANTRTTIVAGSEGVQVTRAFTNVFYSDTSKYDLGF